MQPVTLYLDKISDSKGKCVWKKRHTKALKEHLANLKKESLRYLFKRSKGFQDGDIDIIGAYFTNDLRIHESQRNQYFD